MVAHSAGDAPSATPTHLDLLELARAVRRAAAAGNTESLHAELTRLRHRLRLHVQAELAAWGAPASAAGAVTVAGQRRLLSLVDRLLFDTGTAAGGCDCRRRAAEIELALRRQARLEMNQPGWHQS